MTPRTRCSALQSLVSRVNSRATPGTEGGAVGHAVRCARISGSAGEIRVSVSTRSGRTAATRVATAPPSEFPKRCTGPRSAASR